MARCTGSGREPAGGSSSGRRRFTRAAQAASGPASAEGAATSGKRLDGLGLAVGDVEDGDELGGGEDVGDFRGEVGELQLGAPIGGGGVGTDQLADAAESIIVTPDMLI